MGRIVYVNGDYVDEADAKVSVFDRGFVMGDAVYEVTSVIGGKLIDFPGHVARLRRSLAELDMPSPCTDDELLAIHRELVAKNNISDGGVYLQVSRGNAGDRDFAFPPAGTPPTIVLYTQSKPGFYQSNDTLNGINVISVPDLRWHRRDIKTVQLLWASMAKMAAKKAGAQDAWFVENGFVTEGSSNNAYIVKDGTIITRELSNDLLHGITRAAVLKLAREAQLKVVERSFTIEEAQSADEAFITSATNFCTPVLSIDGVKIGEGKAGPLAGRLHEIYLEDSLRTAI